MDLSKELNSAVEAIRAADGIIIMTGAGMGVDDQPATIGFLPDRIVHVVAEPLVLSVIGEDSKSVGLQCIDRVFDFLERAIDVVHRNRGETAEATGMIRAQLGGSFVAITDGLAISFALAEPEGRTAARGRHGQDRRGDT